MLCGTLVSCHRQRIRTLSPAGQFGPELTAEIVVLQICCVMCDFTDEVSSVVMIMLVVYMASRFFMEILVFARLIWIELGYN